MDSIAEILKNSYEGKSLKSMRTSSSDNQTDENPGIGQADCPYCDGLGYVVLDVPLSHPSFGRAQPCTCRAQEREMQRLSKLLELSQLGALKA